MVMFSKSTINGDFFSIAVGPGALGDMAQVSWSRGPQWEPSRRDQTHESGEPVTAEFWTMDPPMVYRIAIWFLLVIFVELVFMGL